MGFEFNRKTFVLDFDDEDMQGLEVRARSANTGTFLNLLRLATASAEDLDPRGIEEMLTGFASVLVGWNLQIDGEDVPPNLDGLRLIDFQDTFRIVAGWIKACAGVSAPLGPVSSGGAPLEVASIPMAPLSESQAS